ncbi:MAG: hypothetical protein LKE52_05290 [Bacilli bacterium]|nr:hypothetical protein [Bacilli bacterium]
MKTRKPLLVLSAAVLVSLLAVGCKKDTIPSSSASSSDSSSSSSAKTFSTSKDKTSISSSKTSSDSSSSSSSLEPAKTPEERYTEALGKDYSNMTAA